MRLKDKYVLITGASLRIGKEIALFFSSRGAHVIIHYHRSRKAAAALKNEIEQSGSEAFLASCDFGFHGRLIERQITSFVKKVLTLVPRIDVLVNNASVFYPTPAGKIREKEWDEMLTVNLKAPFFLSQEIGKRMVKQGSGKILNLVDWTILRPKKNYLPYTVSKAGLHVVTQTLAKAFAPQVQVNSIAPGPILPVRSMSRREQKKVAQGTLLKRFGDPQDICAAVQFLTEGTDYVTGALIPVDGGSLLI